MFLRRIGAVFFLFADLAYVEKTSGRYGLEKFLKQSDWIENAEELSEKLKDL